MSKLLQTALGACVLSLGFSSPLIAESTFYIGGGVNSEQQDFELDDTPFVLGVLGQSTTGSLVFGGDIAGEGEMLDSTYESNSIRQAYSFNALIGTNLTMSRAVSVDAAAILGIREAFSDCPDSFLGYQCYADQAPVVDYDFNYGAILNVKVNNVSVGLRATQVSTMATIGFNF